MEHRARQTPFLPFQLQIGSYTELILPWRDVIIWAYIIQQSEDTSMIIKLIKMMAKTPRQFVKIVVTLSTYIVGEIAYTAILDFAITATPRLAQETAEESVKLSTDAMLDVLTDTSVLYETISHPLFLLTTSFAAKMLLQSFSRHMVSRITTEMSQTLYLNSVTNLHHQPLDQRSTKEDYQAYSDLNVAIMKSNVVLTNGLFTISQFLPAVLALIKNIRSLTLPGVAAVSLDVFARVKLSQLMAPTLILKRQAFIASMTNLDAEIQDTLRCSQSIFVENKQDDEREHLYQFASIVRQAESEQFWANTRFRFGSDLISAIMFGVLCFHSTPNVLSGRIYVYTLYLGAWKMVEELSNQVRELSATSPSIQKLMFNPQPQCKPFNKVKRRGQEPLLLLENIRYTHGEQEILSNITFELHEGEIVAIAGHNGCGKSTLLKILAGLYENYFGNIKLYGKSISSMSRQQYRDHISYMAQEPMLFNRSVRENLSYPKQLRQVRRRPFLRQLSQQYGEDVEACTLKNNGNEFSGGGKQKLALERAMCKNALIYVLDEPASAMDDVSRSDFMRSIRAILAEQPQSSVVLISHDSDIIEQCDRVLHIAEGVIASITTNTVPARNARRQNHLRLH